MKLKPTHFYDPEPLDNCKCQYMGTSCNKMGTCKDHSEWKARQVKPELPREKSFVGIELEKL